MKINLTVENVLFGGTSEVAKIAIANQFVSQVRRMSDEDFEKVFRVNVIKLGLRFTIEGEIDINEQQY